MCKGLVCVTLIGLVLTLCGQATAGIMVAEQLLVDLRANELPYGAVTQSWASHGTLGDFTPKGAPVVEDVAGRKAVTFNGSSYFEGPVTIAGIQGAGTRSIEVWAYNGADFVSEETMVSWSHRGGPDGTNIGFNYGNNATWGAVGHWGAADMPWSGAHSPAPAAGNWWYLVYTYDGTTVRLYVNAEENTVRAATLNTHGPNIIRVAAQADDAGTGVLSTVNFTGSIAEVRIHDGVLSPAAIANNFKSKPGNQTASAPSPEDGQVDVPCTDVLTWTAGEFAASHDVYLGTTFADVNDASRANPMDVLASEGQADAAYEPPAPLEFGTTYYWRVDEVNAAPDNTIFKGNVWSFTTEPYAYSIETVTATASSFQSTMGPENTVNGSGLDADDQHSTLSADMWMTTGGKPAWIQYEFDQAYALHEMWVWNSNQAIESFLGFGAKDVAIEYSTDGQTWSALENVPEFAKATGAATYTADTTVSFGGVQARFVKLTINANWGGLAQTGLSEVRFFAVPVQAFEPQPADAATAVSVATDLAWRAGRGASSHTVFIGTDAADLGSGQTVTDDSYTPTLDLATTYYWKVDETGDAGTYAGSVWSFTTEEFVAVDDFEGYNDDDNRIYETWVDGLTTEASGSVVGYDQAPFAERTLVHAGKQSMPLIYDNSTFNFAEAERTFETPQDWTRYGATTLVLSFRGQMSNSRNAVYVKIDGKKISYDNGAAATTAYLWKTWAIPLASTGANLKSVKTLTIGVEGSGAGTLFIDDIRLYAVAPQIDTPTDPGTTGLVALYAMDGNVQDGSGKNYHGTLKGDGSYEAGYADQALAFNGINTYVELPLGPLMTTLTDTTIATHVNFGGGSGAWQRIFDLGSGTTAYMFLCPRQETAGNMRFAIRSAAVGEQLVNSPGPMTEDWHHTAVTLDSATMTISLYLDGELVASGPTTILPKDMGETTQNWLGRSQYVADAYFLGSLDDFRIYNRVLSQAELRYLAGDR